MYTHVVVPVDLSPTVDTAKFIPGGVAPIESRPPQPLGAVAEQSGKYGIPLPTDAQQPTVPQAVDKPQLPAGGSAVCPDGNASVCSEHEEVGGGGQPSDDELYLEVSAAKQRVSEPGVTGPEAEARSMLPGWQAQWDMQQGKLRQVLRLLM